MRLTTVAMLGFCLAIMAAPTVGQAQSQRYTGYAPPPPIGPDASTEQPPVVDTLGTGGRSVDRCRESPESAMAPMIIPVELALCALSAPWRSEATTVPAPQVGPSVVPLAATERDPAMR